MNAGLRDRCRVVFLGGLVGALIEPLSGRRWESGEAQWHIRTRADTWRRAGMCHGDRVLLGYGNCLEAMADVVALWSLGVCICSVSPRLTAFEIGEVLPAAGRRDYLGRGAGPGQRPPWACVGTIEVVDLQYVRACSSGG